MPLYPMVLYNIVIAVDIMVLNRFLQFTSMFHATLKLIVRLWEYSN